MKHDYLTLIAARPERIKIEGYIEYVQNPYFSDKPIIRINRDEKTAEDTDVFEEEGLSLEIVNNVKYWRSCRVRIDKLSSRQKAPASHYQPNTTETAIDDNTVLCTAFIYK